MNRFPFPYILILAVFFVLAGWNPASAQNFYKYVDKNGNVHFTDNLDAVPPQYRNQLEVYKEEKRPKAVSPQKIEEAGKAPGKQLEEIRKQEEERAAKEKAEKEAKLKARKEIQDRITELQEQIRAKQEEQRNLRTTWMVYDRIRLNQLNQEIAALSEQVQSLQRELNE